MGSPAALARGSGRTLRDAEWTSALGVPEPLPAESGEHQSRRWRWRRGGRDGEGGGGGAGRGGPGARRAVTAARREARGPAARSHGERPRCGARDTVPGPGPVPGRAPARRSGAHSAPAPARPRPVTRAEGAPERPRSPGYPPTPTPQPREREPRAAGAGPSTTRSSDTGPGTAPAAPAPPAGKSLVLRAPGLRLGRGHGPTAPLWHLQGWEYPGRCPKATVTRCAACTLIPGPGSLSDSRATFREPWAGERAAPTFPLAA